MPNCLLYFLSRACPCSLGKESPEPHRERQVLCAKWDTQISVKPLTIHETEKSGLVWRKNSVRLSACFASCPPNPSGLSKVRLTRMGAVVCVGVTSRNYSVVKGFTAQAFWGGEQASSYLAPWSSEGVMLLAQDSLALAMAAQGCQGLPTTLISSIYLYPCKLCT